MGLHFKSASVGSALLEAGALVGLLLLLGLHSRVFVLLQLRLHAVVALVGLNFSVEAMFFSFCRDLEIIHGMFEFLDLKQSFGGKALQLVQLALNVGDMGL